jgi:hypothetical protein
MAACPAWSAPRMGAVSAERQLRLKLRLLGASASDSLATSLDHNRREWEMLSPDQREHYRREAASLLEKSPDDRDALLKRYEQLIKLSAEKRSEYRRTAEWVRAVNETLTPEQRGELLRMTPSKRADELIRLRDRLVREGRIKLTASQPASDESGAMTTTAPVVD